MEVKYDDDGIKQGYRSSVRDFTERRKNEEVIRKSEARFRIATESAKLAT